ncbi:hypothetical protein BGX27_011433 [Mortierella sp. AM989]|nr:hypothetical protein BGX27_011433 [Mortierella sp. AM989]
MAYITPPITPLSVNDGRDKRISECGFPVKSVKVESPYQSYLNHPFTQQANKPSYEKNQTAQAYISKYNSYTNSSKSIRLITVPSPNSNLVSGIIFGSQKSKSTLNDELYLNSPTSPLVSPPPPYLHSDHGETKFNLGFDSKKQADQSPQQQFAQWPSMMKLSSAKGATTTSLTRPKLARVLPPQAFPIMTTGLGNNEGSYAFPVTSSSSRTSRMMDTKGSEPLYNLQSQHDTYNSVSITVNSTQVPQIHSAHSIPYPVSFWEDVRQSKMHWVLLPYGCVVVGSFIWVVVMQVSMEWLIVVPVLAFLVFAMQFGVSTLSLFRSPLSYLYLYNAIMGGGDDVARRDQKESMGLIRRGYHLKKNKFLKQQQVKNAAVLSSSVVPDQSSDSDAYLRPHQSYSGQSQQLQQERQAHVRFQEPSSAVSPAQFDQQLYKQPRLSQSTKKPNQQQQPQKRFLMHLDLHRGGSNNSLGNNDSPYYQNPNFLSPVDSLQTPPPAYLKKFELPEIDSIGDLVGEFEVDFDAIRY